MNKDYKSAWETYLKLVSYAGTLPFPQLVEKCGMKSPLKQGTLKEVAQEHDREELKCIYLYSSAMSPKNKSIHFSAKNSMDME